MRNGGRIKKVIIGGLNSGGWAQLSVRLGRGVELRGGDEKRGASGDSVVVGSRLTDRRLL